jgi:phosphoserine phosphatase
MLNPMSALRLSITAALLSVLALQSALAQDPLPSWNDTATKSRIISFVEDVTNTTSENFVPAEARIATFDNDGTLWSEQPIYFQIAFSLDHIKAMASDHPVWATTQPFKAVIEDDMKALKASGKEDLLKIMGVAHTGMTEAEFQKDAAEWAATAQYPKTGHRYNEMIYKPMLEILEYLRANGFKTYIVSGGGVQFMRAVGLDAYGIPPEQIIGSSIATKLEIRDGKPVLVRQPDLFFNDDKQGKPMSISRIIGRRPIAAFGNSDGDLQMLQWADAGEGDTLKVFVHHTDAVREWAYDRDSHIGQFDKGLDIASDLGWTIVDMKNDWAVIYPFDAR